MKSYTAKELKDMLAKLPDDTEVWGIYGGQISVEHHTWTENKLLKESHKTITLRWSANDVEGLFVEENGRSATKEEVDEILTEFDNEVHDRLTPTGNELMREIINRA